MASPEPIGVATCRGCKRDTDVKLNSGGYAYTLCGCGHSERTHNQSSSKRFLAAWVKPLNFPAEKPEKPEVKPAISSEKPEKPEVKPPENSGKKPEIPAPAPPKPEPAPEAPPATPPKKKSSFLF